MSSWSRIRRRIAFGHDQDVSPVRTREIQIPAEGVVLPGTLTVPGEGGGVVLFAHGSGSSRHSPRNVQVASSLHRLGLGTVLFDLLTPAEAGDRANVFDIPLLAARLTAATEWVGSDQEAPMATGYFGASTGAAAALWAAADLTPRISAVVSRGGRPDLAGPRLSAVSCPALLIVGSEDHDVLELNRQAQRMLPAESRLEVVPGAGHLFEEPGTLEAVARLAGEWFTTHLRGA
jgi:putative phosphoribosyl transferase